MFFNGWYELKFIDLSDIYNFIFFMPIFFDIIIKLKIKDIKLNVERIHFSYNKYYIFIKLIFIFNFLIITCKWH